MLDPLTIAASGFGLGLVHTLEPDHLAAISTLVGRVPGRARGELTRAVAWAVGHAISLGTFCAVVLFLATRQVSVASARPTAALVGGVLVYLGIARLRGARRAAEGAAHAHAGHAHDHAAVAGPGRRRGALALGVLHGLADSSAILILMPALVTADAASYVLYIAAFGLGSVVSMGSFCWLLARFSDGVHARSQRAGPWLAVATGTLCLAAGVFWVGVALRG
jgi:cytochrome c biogenesis protein CcdA